MNVKCLIVDDEPLAINIIKSYLNDIDSVEIITTFNNAIHAVNFLKDNDVDLIFLDINMPVLNGLNFIKSLERRPLIIITTAYKEYAVETFELDVVDYLVKPISLPRFMKSINKVFNILRLQQKKPLTKKVRSYIFLKINKKRLVKVYLDEILVVESLKDYLKVITTTQRYIIHKTLSSFTKELPADKFIRIHRSFTVSIDKIDVIEGNTIEIDNTRYVIGRTYLDNVKEKIMSS